MMNSLNALSDHLLVLLLSDICLLVIVHAITLSNSLNVVSYQYVHKCQTTLKLDDKDSSQSFSYVMTLRPSKSTYTYLRT